MLSSDPFVQKENSVGKTLSSLIKILPRLKFIKNIYRVYQHSDEIKFYQYSSIFDDNSDETDGVIRTNRRAGGSSLFSEELAFLRCVGETLERHACTVYSNSGLVRGSYAELKERAAIDPLEIVCFSEKQKDEQGFSRFDVSHNTQMTWVKGMSLVNGQEKLIPAHLVYYSYKFSRSEKLIYIPISTGAAGGSCLSAAISRGIFEIIERDSFMIAYLNKLKLPKVDLTIIKDDRIKFIKEVAARYRLELNVIDITTDLAIPSFLTIIIDKSGIGPAVSTGLKADYNPVNAIIGSFEEAVHSRCWTRATYEDHHNEYRNIDPKKIRTTQERGMYWYPVGRIQLLDFWLKHGYKPVIPVTKRYEANSISHGQILKKLIEIFISHSYQAYFVDVTPPVLKKSKYKIVKVIIPKLQPFFQDESFPYLGGKRLIELPKVLGYSSNSEPKFNDVPHPFL